jgi:hypothetical protein
MAKTTKQQIGLTKHERAIHDAGIAYGEHRAAVLPIGDDRTPKGSVSDLQCVVGELHAMIAGASALISYSTSNGEHLGDIVKLLDVAGSRCDELWELLEPEAQNG